jgi:hypothetical protein
MKVISSLILLTCLVLTTVNLNAQVVDPSCLGHQAWQTQGSPKSDPSGIHNIAFPDSHATYWLTMLTQTTGSIVTLRGQFPASRYASLQVYDAESQNILDSINDVSIDPDPGQNNPFRGGIAQGSYTVRLVFARAPIRRQANTIYTGSSRNVGLVYRVYYPNDANDLAGGAANPQLPLVTVGGVPLSSCPPRPVITPLTATVWGRLGANEFIGTKPPFSVASNIQPHWTFTATNPLTPFLANQDNSYISTMLSRDFLKPPYNFDLVVIRMKAPTFNDTQNGVPPYAPAQVRYWSFCTNDFLSTGVVRCTPDNQTAGINGFVTIVISDPSKRPSDTALSQWGATWLPWGALGAQDFVYDGDHNQLTNADGVHYYNFLLYRQTMASPNFAESISNVSKLPANQRQAAMGVYWPAIGYCTRPQFHESGASCFAN